jgi:hypothetical protein
VCALDSDSRQALFAHCVSLSVNAVYEAYNRRPRALDHAGRLAQAVALDMAAAGWKATVESYLGRVTKGRIVDAVREAKGEEAAQRIAHLKKAEMASLAARDPSVPSVAHVRASIARLERGRAAAALMRSNRSSQRTSAAFSCRSSTPASGIRSRSHLPDPAAI